MYSICVRGYVTAVDYLIIIFDRISYFAAGVYYVEGTGSIIICNIIIIDPVAATFECNCSSSFFGRVYGNNMYRTRL